jgi:hypothetical protein
MESILIIILLGISVYAIYRFLNRGDHTSKQTIHRHKSAMGSLQKVTQGADVGLEHIKRTNRTPRNKLADREIAGLPPLGIVAASMATVVVFIAIIAAILVALSSTGKQTGIKTTSTSTSQRHSVRSSTSMTSSTLPELTTVSSTSNGPVYNAPPGKYTITVTVIQPTWVQISQKTSTGQVNLVAQTVSANQSVSQSLSGPCTIQIGKQVQRITVNNIPLKLPPNFQIGTITLN